MSASAFSSEAYLLGCRNYSGWIRTSSGQNLQSATSSSGEQRPSQISTGRLCLCGRGVHLIIITGPTHAPPSPTPSLSSLVSPPTYPFMDTMSAQQLMRHGSMSLLSILQLVRFPPSVRSTTWTIGACTNTRRARRVLIPLFHTVLSHPSAPRTAVLLLSNRPRPLAR